MTPEDIFSAIRLSDNVFGDLLPQHFPHRSKPTSGGGDGVGDGRQGNRTDTEGNDFSAFEEVHCPL